MTSKITAKITNSQISKKNTSSPNLAPFVVSLMLMFGQQLSGMNAVMFYCVDIFKVEICICISI